MASEHTSEHGANVLTPTSYMDHHLAFNKQPVAGGESTFWHIHFDMVLISVILGVVVMGAIWLVARKSHAGVPSKKQAFVELLFDFVDGQAKSMFHGDRHAFIAPTALTVFMWVLAMNMMDLVPIDWFAKLTGFISGDSHVKFRPLPTSDVNTTFALALSVWMLMIFFSIKVKGFGGWIHEIFATPFGAPKFKAPKSAMGFIGLLLSPLLFVANFMFNMIEYISKPLSHSMRLFGNMYASEVIFLLLGMFAATGIFGVVGSAILGAGWAIFHILVVPLQAFIFMMMTIVYLAMAHESH